MVFILFPQKEKSYFVFVVQCVYAKQPRLPGKQLVNTKMSLSYYKFSL